MDFKLSGEQILIKESVERFVAQESMPKDAWSEFAKLGWLAIGAPEELGGFGGAVERLLVMEAFGNGLCLEPFAACAILPGAILRAAGRDDMLERLIEGDRFAVAFEEPDVRYDPTAVTARARSSGDGFVVRGHKVRVPAPHGPATLIVSAELDEEIALFAVPPDAPGVRRSDATGEDGTNVLRLHLEDVPLEAHALVGTREEGLAILTRGLEHATAALCAEAVGVMNAMFGMTLRYMKERTQFGVPIGSFQALQHRMAEMFVELELARSMAYLAAMTVDDEQDVSTRARAVAGAKVQIARSGRFVGQNAIQLHGAIGMTEEFRLGAFFKRMTSLERLYGDVDYQLHQFCYHEPSRGMRQPSTQRTKSSNASMTRG
ncbi:MAG: acyl-CoA dehydrogenase family protein [Candidatus Eremiobacteraeota bacterium]|nr:acyl-CoA dehydrogenase family protein [Candidatus Eremiobacteraeota bacterium]